MIQNSKSGKLGKRIKREYYFFSLKKKRIYQQI